MSRRAEIQSDRRIAAGLPVLLCPQCGKPEPHWVPDAFDDNEIVVPGFFTCAPVAVSGDELDGMF